MRIIIFFCFSLSISITFSQVKVGENPNSINPSAVLEAESTSKGFLPPRMTTAQRDAIQSPAIGLMIFNTSTYCVEVYYGTFWQSIHCGCSLAPSNLSYSDNGPLSYCINQAITINSPATQGGNPSSFGISPVLPMGMFFNTTTGQITGTPTAISGGANYTITALNACGSTSRVLNIAVVSTPSAPLTISGPTSPTTNTTTNYSITAVSGATSYTWTVPTDWTINSGQGTTTISTTAGSNVGNITVTATNTCGTSSASTKAVSPWRSIVATGGTVTNYTANGTNGVNGVQYRVHSFTTIGSATFSVSDNGSDGLADYLVVAGGGGGGGRCGGGGGAGGIIYNNESFSAGNYNVTIGAGGIGAVAQSNNYLFALGSNGSNSSIIGNNINKVAIGGGRGAASGSNGYGSPSSGGSGGGSVTAGLGSGGIRTGELGTINQGYNGGNSIGGTLNEGRCYSGSGGGGAGASGYSNSIQSGDNAKPGGGGIGIQLSISGTPVYYAGGGGGGVHELSNQTNSLGGNGGGGSGGKLANVAAQAGTANTGGGGGGGGANNIGSGFSGAGGNGGSGIVIIRYPLSNPNP
jgi:hypothetical protein